VPAFWVRRALRIWPLYHGFVLLCWAFEGLPWRMAVALAAFAGNWAMLAWPLPGRSLIGPLWSVSVEEQFYLAWPLLLALAPRRGLRPVCLGMISVSLGWRAAVLLNGGGVERVWLNTFSRLDPIAIGALVALWARRRPIELSARARRLLALGAPLVVVAATGVLWHVLLRPSAEVGTPLIARAGAAPLVGVTLVFLVIAVACGAVLIAALAAAGSWLGHPVLVYLGRISYGLYVFHLVGIRPVEALWWPARCVLSFAITALLASISYRFLEQPFLRWKERFTYIPSAPTADPELPLPEPAAVPRAGAVSK
jgi:peptidoglycan/LPS O-acetylase OafA/YrhL